MIEAMGRAAVRREWPRWRLTPPPEGSPEVGRWVWEKYLVMRNHRDRQGLPEVWSHNHELYRGRFFKNKSKWSQVLVNLVWKTINALKSHMTDNRPKCSILPRGETPEQVAKAWQARYDAWWMSTRQQYHLQESVGRSELYGYQVDQMLFNPDLEGGLGEVETRRIDTYGFLTWPGHMDIQTAPMVCVLEPMELGDIYRLWPESEGKVSVESEYSELLPGSDNRWVRANRSRQLRPIGLVSGFSVPEGMESPAAEGGRYGVQRALVIKMWCRDDSTTWVDPETFEPAKKGEAIVKPMIDPATGLQLGVRLVMPEEVKKYPGGIRFIAVTNKGKLVLEDRPNPSINPNLPRQVACETYLWDKFPFIKRLSYSDDISEYGLSIVEQIETLVVEISKKMTQYGVHLDMQCRSPLILPQNCGVKKDHVNNLPARIWEPIASMSQYIRFVQVPQAHSDILAYIDLCIRLVDIITGITDVSEGRRPTGIESGVAIATLQEKAQVVFREKIRNLDLYLEEQARMFISLGQNWYTEWQKVKLEGRNEVEQIDFRGPDFIHELSVHVESGSTLPRNRNQRRQMVVELAKIGKISDKTLFEELDVPNAIEEARLLEMGPIGRALQRLADTGLFDEATLSMAQRVLSMDEDTYKKQFGKDKLFVGQ